MNYKEINFTKVKGYNKLSDPAKEVFENTYRLHNSCQGTDYKDDYKPVSVTENSNKLIVKFKNGVMLYYYPNCTWG